MWLFLSRRHFFSVVNLFALKEHRKSTFSVITIHSKNKLILTFLFLWFGLPGPLLKIGLFLPPKMHFPGGTWQQTAGNCRRVQSSRIKESRTLANVHKKLRVAPLRCPPFSDLLLRVIPRGPCGPFECPDRTRAIIPATEMGKITNRQWLAFSQCGQLAQANSAGPRGTKVVEPRRSQKIYVMKFWTFEPPPPV